MAASAILQGENPQDGEIPPIVSEFFMALEFGWTPEYVRSMAWKDVDIFTTLISLMYKIRGQGKDVFSKAIAHGMR
jgi:hypothetical protein